MEHDTKTMFKAAEIQIIYRNKVPVHERPKITSSNEAYKVLRATWDENRIELIEQFKIMLLNRGNRVIGISEISTGGIDGCTADPRIVYGTALKAGACGMILVHNHPSGNLDPSQADIDLTRKLSGAGKFLDIQVLDHLVINRHRYHSFADEGMMP
ncbi:RadC family protein [Ohtaekwangia kribbensis]|uniref:RadC family protein n=1 Tax=Ohtaekwangia kribbensis TaxID=688913 RepID=A0ABW3K329_9BACT